MENNFRSWVLLAAVMFAGLLGAEEQVAQTASNGLMYLGIGTAVLGAGLGMGMAVGKAVEAMGRNPSAAGEIRGGMILGVVFIEIAVLLAVAIYMIK